MRNGRCSCVRKIKLRYMATREDGFIALHRSLQINLRMMLVSGKTLEYVFSPEDSAAYITQHVYDNWPEDWEDEHLPATNILRLIYQGRFLHGNVTLRALQLPLGRTTVMHLVAREKLPEPNNHGQMKKDKRERASCNNCCTIV